MVNHALIYLFASITCASCILKESKQYFIYENININETSDGCPFDGQQYYWQTSTDDNITQIIKLNCLSTDLSQEKYFPKCCPPNYVYHGKHHKCVQNDMMGILDVFNGDNLLIRTNLFNCSVILDHIFSKDMAATFTINSHRLLNLNDKSYKLGNYCLDNHLDEEEFVIRTCEETNVCRNRGINCIRKCCLDGEWYFNGKCIPGQHFGVSLENITEDLGIEHFNAIVRHKNCKGIVANKEDKFYVMENGTFVICSSGVCKRHKLEENYYCVEYFEMGIYQGYHVLLCHETYISGKEYLKGAFLIVSCIFLLFTLFGYCILPHLRNLIGKIIIAYCSSLLVAFTVLASLYFYQNPGSMCDTFAFIIAFSLMSTFTWTTVLSYETWRAIGCMTSVNNCSSDDNRKRYLVYSMFGWFIPIITIGISFIDHMYHIYPASLHIHLGEKQCVFENPKTKGAYGFAFQFSLPYGILLLINLILFIKTIVYILHVKNEIKKMKMLDGNINQNKWKALHGDQEM